MEAKVARPRGRPRKRPRPEDHTGAPNGKLDNRGKRRVLEVKPTVPITLLGRYVLKDFEDNGVFLGKIVSYDTGLYRVEYEDGDFEDLESRELRQLIIGENYFDDELCARKDKLDELVRKKKVNCMKNKGFELKNQVNGVQTPEFSNQSGGLAVNDDGAEIEDDVDSCGGSSEYDDNRDPDIEAEVPLVPPVQLPPSSGTIGVPEDSVAHLLFVYGFLRSFSIQLFLCPFGVDDFVGALNFSAPNSLLDAIHVALLRALQRHLERLSSDGSELASKCLRCIDWGLLDALTWPVYLVQYFTAMGHATRPHWKIFYEFVAEKEYYSLPVGMKLKILQILCDDIFDVVDIRAEIDIREESEVGFDPDGFTADLPENGPRRVHPRFAKTSACKEKEVIDIVAVNHGMNSHNESKALGSKCSEDYSNGVSSDPDGNSDECRLCGMDGMLLCCDGCPSAYHSRCIGVVKMYIPEGPWYCPECTISKMGPAIALGTLLRGAVFFGMDPHGQLFLGTCNHLLVLKTSINTDADVRYYNVNDIPKVVVVLLSATTHRLAYVDICKAISEYWGLPGDILSHLRAVEMGADLVQVKREGEDKVSGMIKTDSATSSSFSHFQNMKVSWTDSSIDKTIRANCLSDIREQGQLSLNLNPDERIKMDSVASVHSVGREGDASNLRCQSLSDKLTVTGLPACTSGNTSDAFAGRSSGVRNKNSAADVAYMGSCFKSHSYINHYTNGEFAASAAATLAVLSSEETHEPDLHKYSNARKAASNNILLQVKAFSLVASRFFWPSPEKKDIARERCGWCHSCKLTSASRRGCMLNAAVTGATKSATKIFSGLFPLKNQEGSLSSIAAYILYLEESLRGLISGLFLGESHRKHWQKQVEEASTCKAIKQLLLELEENICSIALSSDWLKVVDDWLIEHSIFQSAPFTVGTTQKRGPGRRRQKNQAEVTAEGRDDDSFTWWRGGKLSKLILLKAILSRPKIRKAACQGGVRKISGFNYGDGSGIPKRSRQSIWRAAVESSKNISQLALQVRYLDTNIRWSELVRPEQNPQDVKGPETEASVFRNARICDKKIIDNKVRYGVAFGNQKHLPSRVMKSVIDVEKTQDGNEKYWFQEARVPLYLTKEYEESLHSLPLPSTKKPSSGLSKLQRKQLKASRRDIFSYLASRRENMEKCSCASCQFDVLLRDATMCSACQGFCHKGCTLSSQHTNGKVEVLVTCKRCFHVKARSLIHISYRHPTIPVPVISAEHQNAVTPVTKTQIKPLNQQLTSLKTREKASGIKQVTPDSNAASKSKQKTLSWGVMWRKKNCEDTGVSFRHENILLAGRSDKPDLEPVCWLCQQPYNPGLSYIHCKNCTKWYHIEAIKLEESRIPDVVGFKCCKCRRIRSPDCPYMDPMLKEQKQTKKSTKGQKQGQGNTTWLDSDSERMSEPKDSKPATPSFPLEDAFVPGDDPLLLSVSKVEQITENNLDLEWNTASSLPGPQKLPVRRQVKREDNVESFSGYNLPQPEFSTYPETNPIVKPEEEQTLPVTEWNASGDGIEGDLMFDYRNLNYEDMEFEPQTYFSLTELLTTDDGSQCDGFGYREASGNMDNQYSSNPQVELTCTASNDQPEMANSEANNTPCQICSHLDPAPDLSCQVCGLLIHSHCSPWEEESSCSLGSWSCGRCREWR